MSNVKYNIKFEVNIPHVGHPLYNTYNNKVVEITDKKNIVIKDNYKSIFIRHEQDLIPIKFATLIDTGVEDVFTIETFMQHIISSNLKLPLKIEYSDFFRGTRQKGDLIFISDVKDLAVVTQTFGSQRLVISKLKHMLFQLRGQDHVKTV